MQTHIFNDLEGIRIAVEMERRGRDFYGAAARLSHGEEMKALLNALRLEEDAHMGQFQRLYERERARASGGQVYSAETSAYLTAVAADVVFSEGLVAVGVKGGFQEPQVMLAEGIRSEQQSIDFYRALSEAARDERTAAIFREILEQEQMHLERLKNQLEKYSAGFSKG